MMPATPREAQIGLPLLKVERLSKTFQPTSLRRNVSVRWAVRDLSFSIHPGETYGLVGESGCGKSTTGRMLQQLIPATCGTVTYRGTEIGARSSRKERKHYATQVQTIFQDPYGSLNPRFRIGKSLEEVLRIHRIATGSEARRRVERALEEVGFDPSVGRRFPHEFSGGQRQRIGIARALIVEPSLIICDEPTSALDVSVQSQILNLLKGLQREKGLSCLFISHDLNVVKYMAHRIGVMYAGRKVEEALAATLFEHPQHPYTRVLLSSVPTDHPSRRAEAAARRGNLTYHEGAARGCALHDECALALPDDPEARFKMRAVGADHFVSCHSPLPAIASS